MFYSSKNGQNAVKRSASPGSRRGLAGVLVALLAGLPQMAPAQSASLFPGNADTSRAAVLPPPLSEGAQARTAVVPAPAARTTQPRTASLFIGAAGEGLFAALPDRPAHSATQPGPRLLPGGGPAERLRHLIAEAEAGRAGYDAVNHGARIKPPLPPTAMTVGEIYQWIAATPGQPHAIGRYQFIPSTLRRLVKAQGIHRSERFSPAVQDRLADQLLVEAGLLRLQGGEITRRTFMHRLAKVWAGLPLPSGKSYYQGFAGNKATMTWARFEQGMRQIFPG